MTEKKAQLRKRLAGLPLIGGGADMLDAYIKLALMTGVFGGVGAGLTSAYVNQKDGNLAALKNKKKFYDRKIDEMKNENWLNELMDTRRKLETARLSDDERSALEKRYVELINK